jgi:hypothetical protein
MDRFWNKVKKTDECWNWIASVDKDGYGKFSYESKTIRAHKMSWLLAFNKLSDRWLLHKCNNRKCVNPDHLYEGSPRDNTKDSIKAGTFLITTVRLTDKQREEIKIKKKILSFRQLAKEYEVSIGTIQKAIKNRIYK